MRKIWGAVVGCLLLAIMAPAQATGPAWNYEQGDAARTGYNPDSTAGIAVRPLWTSSVDPVFGSGFSGGVLGGGHIYIAGNDSRLYALNPDTGATDWSSPVPGSYMPGTPAYDAQANQVYVTISDSPEAKLYAFNATDGSLAWSAPLHGKWSAGGNTPVIVGNTVITAADGSGTTVYGFDATTGQERWRQFTSGGQVPAASGNRVFLGYLRGQANAFDATSGELLWTHSVGYSGGGRYMATAANGLVYVATSYRVTALHEADGTVAWARTTGLNTAFPGGSAVADGVLWVPQTGGVAALDGNTGEVLQRLSLGNCSYNAATVPVISSTHVFVPCGTKIYAVDRQTYAATAIANGRGPLALDGNRLYYLSTASYGYRLAALESGPAAVRTQLSVTASGLVQYSDPVTLTATLTLADGTPLAGATIRFAISGESAGTAVTDDQGKAVLTWIAALSAGAYRLTATYDGDRAANLAGASAATDLSLLPEVAVIQAVTPDLVATTSGREITLTATLAEEADGHPGPLDMARVIFRVLDDAQNVLVTALAPVTVQGDGTGTAEATIDMLPEGIYTIEAAVQSWGYYASADLPAPLIVDTPVDGNRVSGGGWLQQEGLKSTFGLNVGQSRSNSQIKGSLLYMFHDKESRQLLKIQVRKWDTLAVVGSQAIATGTGTVTAVDPGHAKARQYSGSYSVLLAVADGGTDYPDVFELTVRDASGNIFYEVRGEVDGGNLQVISP